MTRRNPIMVVLLPILTLGIYYLVWYVTTKNEMNTRGANIPTAWLLVIPIANFFWIWEFSKGVELVTNKGMGAGAAFVLLLFLGTIGGAIVQSNLNKVAT